MVYALAVYHWRLRNIMSRRTRGYHDPFGPTILAVLLIIALVTFSVGRIVALSKNAAAAAAPSR